MQQLIQYVLSMWSGNIDIGINQINEMSFIYAIPDDGYYKLGGMFTLTILAMIITVNVLLALLNIFRKG